MSTDADSLFLAIYLGHHNVAMAVSGLLIMLAYAAVLVFGSRRSEAVALIRGDESTTWAGLCAVLGGTYLLSTIVLTRRG